MEILVIAEKKKYAEVLVGYFEKKLQSKSSFYSKGNYYLIQNYKIAYCSGHLIGLKQPNELDEKWKQWDFNNMPIIPENYETKVVGTEREQKIYHNLISSIKKASYIIHCGDPDREGQIIVDEMLKEANYSKKVDRVWINATVYDKIDEAFNALKPNHEYSGMSEAGITRRDSDYIMGMNYSRMAQILLDKKRRQIPQKTEEKLPAHSLGRVITPSVKIIVQRYKEIKDFKPKPFYAIHGDLICNGIQFNTRLLNNYSIEPYCDSEGRIIDLNFAGKFCDKANECFNGKIVTAKIRNLKRSHPLLYNLSKLQTDANKLFKISPDTVMECMQELYLAGITSYPRTDNQYAYEADFENYENVSALLKEHDDFYDYIIPGDKIVKSPSWNDKKASKGGHTAIILIEPDIDKLHMIRYKNMDALLIIFKMVAIRYLAQFYENKIEEETLIEVEYSENSTYIFKHRSLTLVQEGFDKIIKTIKGDSKVSPDFSDEDKDSELERGNPELKNIQVGMPVSLGLQKIFFKELKTTPPSKMTFGKLIEILSSIHLYIKDFKLNLSPEEEKTIRNVYKEVKGIGTEATRAETTKKLVERLYVVEKKGIIEPTPRAIELIELLEELGLEQIYSPVITARNEMGLAQIEEGALTRKEFLSNLEKIITGDLQKVKNAT